MSQQARRNLTRLLSLVVAVLCMGLSIFAVRAGKGTQPEFQLGDFSGVSVEEKQKAFEESQSSEDLVELLKVLCYQAVVEENKAVEPLNRRVRYAFIRRARAGRGGSCPPWEMMRPCWNCCAGSKVSAQNREKRTRTDRVRFFRTQGKLRADQPSISLIFAVTALPSLAWSSRS